MASLTQRILYLAAAVFTAVVAHSAHAHPQDGPHCDVRLMIGGDSVSVRLSMNLVFLDEIIDAPREIPDELEASELPAMRAELLAYLRAQHPVTVDGVVLEPTATPLVRNDPDPALLPLFPSRACAGCARCR